MSEIITDKLTGKTSAGDVTITSEGGSATMQLQQGVAKAWINQDDQTTIQDSFNVASLTDVANGRGGVNFVNNMSNATFAPMAEATNGNGDSGINNASHERDAIATSKFNMRTGTTSPADMDGVIGLVHGDLA